MRVVLRDLLTERADGVEPGRLDPSELVAQGQRAVTRRRRVAVTAAGLVAAAAVGGATVVLGSERDDEVEPAPPVEPAGAGVPRPLTYGLGQTLHLGATSTDTGLDFLSLDLTDDGAVLTTLDGRVWFTDGSGVDQIGATEAGGVVAGSGVTWPRGRPREWVTTEAAGSLAAWVEYPRDDEAVLAVQDTATQGPARRYPIELRVGAYPLAIIDGIVWVGVAPDGGRRGSLMAVDSATGDLVGGMWREFDAATRGLRRTVVLDAPDGRVMGAVEPDWAGLDDQLLVVGGRLVSRATRGGLFDGVTGEPLTLRVPGGYESAAFYPVQWLDDDRFALIQGDLAPVGDVLVCRLSTELCEVAIDAEEWASEPLTPGDGGVGAERAISSAVQSWS